jgi:hypothetical protein
VAGLGRTAGSSADGAGFLDIDLVCHGLHTSSLQKQKSPRAAGFFFFYSKFRISGSEEKTANFVGVEVPTYQRLLLWVSGGNLTKASERAVSGKTVSQGRLAKGV